MKTRMKLKATECSTAALLLGLMGCQSVSVPVRHVSKKPTLKEVQTAFQGCPTIPYKQSWLKVQQKEFEGGTLSISWNEKEIMVLADLKDHAPHNPTKGFNKLSFLTGDVFEIFLRRDSSPSYLELHVTPENYRTQMRHPSQAAADAVSSASSLEEAIAKKLIRSPRAFDSETWVHPAENRWLVFARLPATELPGGTSFNAADKIHFLGGRYDYQSGRKDPVLSATGPLKKARFHRLKEWNKAVLEADSQ